MFPAPAGLVTSAGMFRARFARIASVADFSVTLNFVEGQLTVAAEAVACTVNEYAFAKSVMTSRYGDAAVPTSVRRTMAPDEHDLSTSVNPLGEISV